MRGERTLLNTVFGRAAAVLLTAAVALVLAPVAAATPESDADRRDQPRLGRQRRHRGPAGHPATAASTRSAAASARTTPAARSSSRRTPVPTSWRARSCDKYQSLGGPADGDLGFPDHRRGRGQGSPDSRNTTFSAADKPVIFWTPDTGAHVVRGAINAAWDKLGGSAGPLGVPTDDEVYNGDVVSQTFTGGEMSWNRATKEFTTAPPELADQLAGLDRPRRRDVGDQRRPAGGRWCRWVRWAPNRAASTRSARTAPGRTSPAARSSTARPPAPTWSPVRSSRSTSPSAARRATWASRPATRPTAA